MFSVLLFISTFTSGQAYTLDDFDFSGLTRDDDNPYTYETTSYTLAFNFRKALSSYNGTACETDADCIFHRWTTGTTTCKCFGDYSTETYSIAEDGSGLNFTYIYDEEQTRFTIFQLICDDAESMQEPDQTALTIYTITWYLPQACPGSSSKSSSSSSSSSKLSVGSILLIIIAAVIVIYIVVGVIVSATCLHKRGLEIIPCFFFWSSLPGLVLDGVKCLIPCARRSSEAATYDEV